MSDDPTTTTIPAGWIAPADSTQQAQWAAMVAQSVAPLAAAADQVDFEVRTLRYFRQLTGDPNANIVWDTQGQAEAVNTLWQATNTTLSYADDVAASKRIVASNQDGSDLGIIGTGGEDIIGFLKDSATGATSIAMATAGPGDAYFETDSPTNVGVSGPEVLLANPLVGGVVVVVGVVALAVVAYKSLDALNTYIKAKQQKDLVTATQTYQQQLVDQGIDPAQAAAKADASVQATLLRAQSLAQADIDAEKARNDSTKNISDTVTTILWGAAALAALGGAIYIGVKLLPKMFEERPQTLRLAAQNPAGNMKSVDNEVLNDEDFARLPIAAKESWHKGKPHAAWKGYTVKEGYDVYQDGKHIGEGTSIQTSKSPDLGSLLGSLPSHNRQWDGWLTLNLDYGAAWVTERSDSRRLSGERVIHVLRIGRGDGRDLSPRELKYIANALGISASSLPHGDGARKGAKHNPPSLGRPPKGAKLGKEVKLFLYQTPYEKDIFALYVLGDSGWLVADAGDKLWTAVWEEGYKGYSMKESFPHTPKGYEDALKQVKKSSKGSLDKYAWPGGYPLYYLAQPSNDVLCSGCATEERLKPDGEKLLVDANWENPDMWCDNCNKRIESAYADD